MNWIDTMDQYISIHRLSPTPQNITRGFSRRSEITIDRTITEKIGIMSILTITTTEETVEKLLQYRSDTTEPSEWSQQSVEISTGIITKRANPIDIMIDIIVKSNSMTFTPGTIYCFQV